MRRYLAVASLLLFALPATSSAATSTVTVAPGNNRVFSPDNMSQRAGGTVVWSKAATTDEHNVSSMDGLFRSGATTMGAFRFTRAVSAGSFAYQCERHGDQGMRGMLRVKPVVKAAPRGAKFTVLWAATSKQTGKTFDVQYRIGRGAWRNWKRGTSATKAVFGARNKPVRVSTRKSYSFRVVSKSGALASGRSPAASFSP